MRTLRGRFGTCAECGVAFARDEPITWHHMLKGETIHLGCVREGTCWACNEPMFRREARQSYGAADGPRGIHTACLSKANSKAAKHAAAQRAEQIRRESIKAEGALVAGVKERTLRGEHVVVVCADAREKQRIAAQLYLDRSAAHAMGTGGFLSVTWGDRRGTALVGSYSSRLLVGRNGMSHVYLTTFAATRHKTAASIMREQLAGRGPDGSTPEVEVVSPQPSLDEIAFPNRHRGSDG